MEEAHTMIDHSHSRFNQKDAKVKKEILSVKITNGQEKAPWWMESYIEKERSLRVDHPTKRQLPLYLFSEF
jgi:hypothetical protein